MLVGLALFGDACPGASYVVLYPAQFLRLELYLNQKCTTEVGGMRYWYRAFGDWIEILFKIPLG